MLVSLLPATAFADESQAEQTTEQEAAQAAAEAAAKAAAEQAAIDAAAAQNALDQNAVQGQTELWTQIDEIVAPGSTQVSEPETSSQTGTGTAEPAQTPAQTSGSQEPQQNAAPTAQDFVDAFNNAIKNQNGPVDEKTVQAILADVLSSAPVAAKKAAVASAIKVAEASVYPAFGYAKVIEGTNILVSVNAPAGAFPSGIQLFAEAVATPEEVLDAITFDRGTEVAQSDTLSVDIHFYLPEDPETEIEPLTPISVTFANINLDAAAVDVYHETEKVAEVSGEGGTVQLDQFSTYTFVASQGDGESTMDNYKAQGIAVRPAEAAGNVYPLITKDGAAVTDFTGWTFSSSAPAIATIAPDGAITPVAPGRATITANAPAPDAAVTLTFVVDTFALVKYDLNGGTGSVADTEYGGRTPSASAASAPARAGYDFLGWAEADDAIAADYAAGADLSSFFATVTNDPDTWVKTLHAVWMPMITFKVTKAWDDDNNRDGVRPAGVDIELYWSKDGSSWSRNGSTTLNDANGWTVSFTPRRARATDGTMLQWKVVEATAMSDYTTAITADAGTPSGNEIVFTADEITNYINNNGGAADVTVTNTHTPEKLTVTVNKVWDDANDNDGKRPDSVIVNITATGSTTANTLTLTEAEGWTNQITLFRFENGAAVDYAFTEEAVEGYTASQNWTVVPAAAGSGDATGTLEITNTHTPETIHVVANKIWDDDDNAEGKRTAVTLKLVGTIADGTVVSNVSKPIALGSDSVDFGNKKKYYKGEEINWDLTEDPVDGYTTDIVKDDSVAGTVTYNVTNTFIPTKTDVTITKIWMDGSNAGQTRPNSVLVRLMNNGAVVKTALLGEQNAQSGDTNVWTITFTDVPLIDNNGNTITYYVEEGPVSGYTTQIEALPFVADFGYEFIVTNTYGTNDQTINVTAVWDDAEDQDGLRPDTAGYTLTGGNDDVKISSALQASSNWTVAIPTTVYGPAPAYEKLTYTVTPADVPDYTYEVTGDQETGFTITYKHEPATFSLSVMKTWEGDDGNRDNTRQAVEVTVWSNVTDGGPGKPVSDKKVATATLDVTKDYSEVLYLEDLPVFENGQKLFYWIDEGEYEADPTAIVDGYVTSADLGFGPNGLIFELYPNTFKLTYDDIYTADNSGIVMVGFINTYSGESETVQIKVTKVWDDSNNQDGLRPAAIQGHVKGYVNGEVVVERDFDWGSAAGGTSWSQKTTTLTTDNDRNPFYKYYQGQEIEYVVTEDTVNGYETTITGDVANGFTVTNTHTPETIHITAEKVWDDDDNRDGLRANVKLTLEGRTPAGTLVSKTEQDHGGDNMTFDFGMKARYYEGEEIVWKLTEEAIDGYTTVVTSKQDAETGDIAFTVTNTHEIATGSVKIWKVWEDDSNRDGLRPRTLTVELRANGETVDWYTMEGTSASWQYTFENLPVFENGEAIEYSFVESAVPFGYTVTYGAPATIDNATNSKTIKVTNTHVPEVVVTQVTKVWNDNDDADAVRPDVAEFKLEGYVSTFAQAVITRTITIDKTRTEALPVSTDDNGAPLYAYFRGLPVTYTLKETPIDGYTSEITGDMMTGFTVTNTHEQDTISITVLKNWDDNNNQDGLRPEFVNISLRANGVPVHGERLSAANNWAYHFENLPAYENGAAIEYTVVETVPEGYAQTAGADAKVTVDSPVKIISLTNQHVPETVSVKVTKKWADDTNADAVRPTELTYTLYANGVPVETITKTKTGTSSSWGNHTWNDLPKYQNGTLVSYSVYKYQQILEWHKRFFTRRKSTT